MTETGQVTRRLFGAATLLAMLTVAMPASAQRDLTDGAATFEINSFAGIPWSADFATDGDDDLWSFGFYHRIDGATRERIFGAPDTESFTGNTALLSWTDFDSTGLDAGMTITLTGIDDDTATLDIELVVNNPTASAVSIDLFGGADVDVGGISGNVASLQGNRMYVESASGTRSATLEATPMWTNYRGGAVADILPPLNDSDIDDYDNAGLPFTGDFAGGYQWAVSIDPGGSETVALRISFRPPSSCGDGIVDAGAGEVCDDGFNDACGTCNADCTGPGVAPTCGDGFRCMELEACDDGFTDACGTCNATCDAVGAASVCGDGAVCDETEQCDDGGTMVGDGCSATCTVERRLADGMAVFDELVEAFGLVDFSADGALDQLVSHRIFHRVGAASRETPFAAPDSAAWVGNVAMLGWTDVDGTGLDAVAVITLSGSGPTTADATVSLTLSNPGAVDVPVELFAFADPSTDGTSAGDTATLDGARLTVTDAPARVVFTGAGADRFQMGGGEILGLLGDAAANDLSNTGHEFSGDVRLALQWHRIVPAGGDLTVEYTLALTAAPICGDGRPDHTEPCDDGNTTSGDGCSATCQIEGDAGMPDAGVDGGPALDAGSADAGTPDAGAVVDAGLADGGTDEGGPDAGLVDSGPPRIDAGSDAGPLTADGGPPATFDGGPTTTVDAGSIEPPTEGCSCRATRPSRGGTGFGLGVGVLAWLFVRRRR